MSVRIPRGSSGGGGDVRMRTGASIELDRGAPNATTAAIAATSVSSRFMTPGGTTPGTERLEAEYPAHTGRRVRPMPWCMPDIIPAGISQVCATHSGTAIETITTMTASGNSILRMFAEKTTRSLSWGATKGRTLTDLPVRCNKCA